MEGIQAKKGMDMLEEGIDRLVTALFESRKQIEVMQSRIHLLEQENDSFRRVKNELEKQVQLLAVQVDTLHADKHTVRSRIEGLLSRLEGAVEPAPEQQTVRPFSFDNVDRIDKKVLQEKVSD